MPGHHIPKPIITFPDPKMFNVNDTEGRAKLLYAPVVVRGIGMCV